MSKTLKFDEHTQRLGAELHKHYPVMIKDDDRVFTGHGECVCGKAVANGTKPYCDIWADHIRDVAKSVCESAKDQPAAPQEKPE